MNTNIQQKRTFHFTIRPFGAAKFQVYCGEQLLATFSDWESAALHAERSARSFEKRGYRTRLDVGFSGVMLAAA